jgi:hypothetical protein
MLSRRGDTRVGRSNVVVHVRFGTAEARRLGVDGHVCELQLNLAAFIVCMVVRVEAQML